MLDAQGRSIDYVRISVTDRCNLRCVYCMPESGVKPVTHGELLRYEEIVRLTRLLAQLGVRKVRITGGEPLVRRDLPALIREIKALDGIEMVCLTTNGLLLKEQLSELLSSGLDSVNISLDALDETAFEAVTRRRGVSMVLDSIDAALCSGLPVKINCVLTELNERQLVPMAERFLSDERLALRFIELMPIGLGKTLEGISPETVAALLSEHFGKMTPLEKESMDGPCSYYKLGELPGRLGFISAVSNCFCESCNRVRLTSTGFLKACLQYDHGVELKPLLQGSDETILSAMRSAIWEKPKRHSFGTRGGEHLERHIMSQIGG